jgi:hypothetical protein
VDHVVVDPDPRDPHGRDGDEKDAHEDHGRLAVRRETAHAVKPPGNDAPGSFLRFTRVMRSSFIRAIKAGTSVKLIRRMTRVPKATRRPKIFTGRSPTASEAKPAAVVRSE